MIGQLALRSGLFLVATSIVASAQPAAPARAPDMTLALEAAQTALSTCAANGVKASASIVDSAGVLKVLLAADGASKAAVESSTKKAFTANALKAATFDILEKMKTDKALETKVNADTTLFVRPGGLPLMAGNDVIGAIGVGGASTLNGVSGGERDAVCATAGLEKIKARLK
ncbi:MAG: hypothetical protein QOI12_1475 [Alphaproteobacteria bacterium]|jgi:uncharacterized protein GlcG (DUF336 family)|nr:hypothetical protein [Alphaproteobacteria bacterium]